MTARQFRTKAERMFRQANPTAAPTFTWTWTSRPCPNASGHGQFRTGRVTVTAPGYNDRQMIVTANADGSGMIVR